ncbi:HNH endonuclease family protein [Agromyces salentinus]|uniref:GmrSD restriction endonucleases C-terminal domain-containing protein n=1 Tax=Agromyces salentinus TaxID=269421 RepID=A0ABN2MZL3_9MICO|nr:HNH endonuclease family protein [Agromyces salentinus]
MPRRRRSRRSTFPALVILAMAFGAWLYLYGPGSDGSLADGGLLPGLDRPGTPTSPTAPAVSDPDLEALVVAEGNPSSRYDRDLFGEAWLDVDGNGCDTRNDVLKRDLADVRYRADSADCVVRTGTLTDPYTNTVISFVRGPDTSEAVQIDHVVPLSYAWRHGASEWTADVREAFANDTANLIAVDGPTNQSKQDSGPAEWMPPSADFACTYVDRFAAVLVAYGLTIAPEDLDAIRRVEAGCA